MVFSVSAANAGTEITVSEEIGEKNDTVIVSVSITGNTGFKAYGMSLEYDEDVLELQAIEAGELSNTGLFQGTVKTGIIGYANSNLVEGDGVLFTAAFKILTNVAGEYEVAIEVDAIGVAADDVMEATTENGSVTVEHVHNFGDWTEAKKATCEDDGEEARECSECGEVETRPIPATGHSFGEWTETKNPSCEDDGEETRTCACGEVETRPIPATGHSFSEWTETKKPSCEDEGEETRTCACGEKETRPIPATGHSFGDWVVTKEPKEEVAGEEARECTVCGEVETRPIDPLPKVGDVSIALFLVLVVCALGAVVVCFRKRAFER